MWDGVLPRARGSLGFCWRAVRLCCGDRPFSASAAGVTALVFHRWRDGQRHAVISFRCREPVLLYLADPPRPPRTCSSRHPRTERPDALDPARSPMLLTETRG